MVACKQTPFFGDYDAAEFSVLFVRLHFLLQAITDVPRKINIVVNWFEELKQRVLVISSENACIRPQIGGTLNLPT
jgi:hypothetical protein